MANNSNVTINRSYIDNFSVKEFTENELIEKYFPDVDVSLRTVGMVGFTTEQISNISEDLFNTATVLFRETFPNRAQIPESLYSHAAIFQLTNVFASASACNFLLVMEEDAIIENMKTNYDKDTGFYKLFIDKDTVITIQDVPYVLDYDIEIKVVDKGNGEYIFSASYIIPEYYKSAITADNKNNDPYIKIRRGKNKYVAMEVRCHQCTRRVVEETILTSDTINYPTININFDGYLAAFDVLYKTSKEDEYSTQLKTQVVYSQPIAEPFCYFQLVNNSTLRITFNTKDDFFIPEYNSTLKITLYTTLGESANFDVYNGDDIGVAYNTENYSYPVPFLSSAKPLSSSIGGSNQMSLDALQSLTVMQYRTATALTSEADLSEYFNNYKHLYGESDVLFIKKRNDICERIYSAFILMRNKDYIYHSNTLNLNINLSDMETKEENVYLIEPGTLFKASKEYGYAEFYRDANKTVQNEVWYQEYAAKRDAGLIPYSSYLDSTRSVREEDLPDYLVGRQMSFSDYKRMMGYEDKCMIFDYESYSELRAYDDPHHAIYDESTGKLIPDNHFLYINPFLIRFKKSPNLVSTYMTYINQLSTVDFISQNEESYVQFITYQLGVKRAFSKEKKYTLSMKIGPSVTLSDDYPIINNKIVITDDGPEVEFDLNNKYNTINNDLRVFVVLNDPNDKPVCYVELYPTEYQVSADTFTFTGEFFTDDHITSNGYIRVLPTILYKETKYARCLNTAYGAKKVVPDDMPNFDSETMIHISDVIADIPDIKVPEIHDGESYDTKPDSAFEFVQITLANNYYEVSSDSYTVYYHYIYTLNETTDEYEYVIETNTTTGLPVEYSTTDIQRKLHDNEIKKWSQVTPLTGSKEILVPMEKVNCTIYMGYRRMYDEESGTMKVIDPTNPLFIGGDWGTKLTDVISGSSDGMPDTSINNYIVTNVYDTSSDPVTFLKPLNFVRSTLTFKDFTEVNANHEFVNNIMDVNIYSIPFLRWSTYLDDEDTESDEKLAYFMNTFTRQYDNLTEIINTKLRNETAIDVKLYNTYGRSRNFTIGENNENLDTINLALSFDMWFTPGTDLLTAVQNVKLFIKEEIETINSEGLNNLYISNLMRKIESRFSYVDHIRFNNINGADTSYQSVREIQDLTEISVDARRMYVPEFLVVDVNDITINEYFSS